MFSAAELPWLHLGLVTLRSNGDASIHAAPNERGKARNEILHTCKRAAAFLLRGASGPFATSEGQKQFSWCHFPDWKVCISSRPVLEDCFTHLQLSMGRSPDSIHEHAASVELAQGA
jgi:hypothetical protein